MKAVAIQGIRGSYSEEAARRLLGDTIGIVECETFDRVLDAFRRNEADCLVLPIENKIVGEIAEAKDLYAASGLREIDRIRLTVDHVLVGTTSATIENIRSVRSHIEALRQCNRLFAENLELEPVIGDDTASSIRQIMDDAIAENAAIGSRRAAEMYGGKILRENIADEPANWTEFYLISG